MSEDSRAWKDQYMLRLPDGMRDGLKEQAARYKRSLNAEIVHRLADYALLEGEVSRLRKKLEDAEERATFYEKQATERAGGTQPEALASSLPAGLYGRLVAASAERGRSVLEEVVQALEAAFPPPPPFSLDWFNEEWLARIIMAEPSERPDLIDQANEVLRANNSNFEVWLGDGGEDEEGAVMMGRRLFRELQRVKAKNNDEIRDVVRGKLSTNRVVLTENLKPDDPPLPRPPEPNNEGWERLRGKPARKKK